MTRVRTPLDPALRSLDLFFDPDALSALFNRPVRISHLRWKRGTSAVARLHDDDGVRWLAMYSAETSVKMEKTCRRARAQDVELKRIVLDDGILASGPIPLDPRLHGALRPFRRHGLIIPSPEVRVLKYNPFRRVVLEVTTAGTRGLVCRVNPAGPTMTRTMLSNLAESGVPVVVPLDPALLPPRLPSGLQFEYLPWFGSGDLSTVPPQDAEPATHAVGSALALLHRQSPIHQTHAWRAPAGRLRSLVEESAELMTQNRDRLERVRSELEGLLRRPGRAAVIHGDFSADQVLVNGGDVRLIDFERCTYGAAASDLGSFAAVEALAADGADHRSVLTLPRTAALLDGYGMGPGTVNESEVLAWTAFYLLNRLREPFRACAPDWRNQMEHRLGMLEEVLW
jgi:hypothetical protein